MQIRVVIADDHTLVREGVRNILEQSGDIVVLGEASDGEQAVQMVADLSPDVVLMDIAMPRLNGVEATRRIKARSPATAVLVVSALDEAVQIFSMLEAGAAGYLLKSIRGDDLLGAIRAVHAGELVLSPSVARKALGRLTRAPDTGQNAGQDELLTTREKDVLLLLCRGLSNKAIAAELSLSLATVKTHLTHLFEKLGVASRTEAMAKAIGQGAIQQDTRR